MLSCAIVQAFVDDVNSRTFSLDYVYNAVFAFYQNLFDGVFGGFLS